MFDVKFKIKGFGPSQMAAWIEFPDGIERIGVEEMRISAVKYTQALLHAIESQQFPIRYGDPLTEGWVRKKRKDAQTQQSPEDFWIHRGKIKRAIEQTTAKRVRPGAFFSGVLKNADFETYKIAEINEGRRPLFQPVFEMMVEEINKNVRKKIEDYTKQQAKKAGLTYYPIRSAWL